MSSGGGGGQLHARIPHGGVGQAGGRGATSVSRTMVNKADTYMYGNLTALTDREGAHVQMYTYFRTTTFMSNVLTVQRRGSLMSAGSYGHCTCGGITCTALCASMKCFLVCVHVGYGLHTGLHINVPLALWLWMVLIEKPRSRFILRWGGVLYTFTLCWCKKNLQG